MRLGVGRLGLVLVLGVVASAGAQQLDARWAPFAGCWELVDGGATSCVAPSTAGAVTLTTIVGGKPVVEQTIVADGADHALTEPDCTGSQRHEWSRDGRRLFGRAELRCASQPVRTVTALSLMTGDNSWLDVQAIEIAGSTSLRLRKYRRAGGNAPRPPASIAPYLGAATFTVDGVKEAHAKVSPAVLEAALAETGARFALSARDLVALDDAGVTGNVIDLMIAASYPEKFQVERRAAASVDAYPPTFGPASFGSYWGLGYPYFYSSPGYDVYYRDYPYGYAYPGSYYYYLGPSVAVDGGGESSAAQDGDGRAVNGVGYTRVRTREASPKSETSSSGSSSPRESSSGRGAITSSGATQSSAGSSSSDSSPSGGGGSSSGSGSSDSGRTAQPR